MKKTYADECLERASRATAGPWRYNGIENARIDAVTSKNAYMHVDTLSPKNSEFIAHSRTDVPELARRLKKVCEWLRLEASNKKVINQYLEANEMNCLAQELEAPPEEK